jgi:diguanylate cyclase (GGDEF)-like protein/PAS domain S-box-containing protein
MTSAMPTPAGMTDPILSPPALLDAIATGIILLAPDGGIHYANASAVRMLGIPIELLLHRSFDQSIWPAAHLDGRPLNAQESTFACVLHTRQPVVQQEITLTRPDDSWVAVSMCGSPVLAPSGTVQAVVCSFTDITARVQAERALREREEMTQSARQHATEQLTRYAHQQSLIAEFGQRALERPELPAFLCEAVERLAKLLAVECAEILEWEVDATHLRLSVGIGWPVEMLGELLVEASMLALPGESHVTDSTPSTVSLVLEPALTAVRGRFHACLRSGIAVPIQGHERLFGVLGIHTSQERQFTPDDFLFMRNMANVLGAAIDHHQYAEQLRYLSMHDALTGLFNRAFFDEELSRLERGRRFPVTIFMIDLDGLKGVNDHLGHTSGDDLLRRAAAVLIASFRAEDVVARTGGDEFAVLVPNLPPAVISVVMGRIMRNLATSNAEAVVALGFSIGTATATAREELYDALKEADSRMYFEKRKRKLTADPYDGGRVDAGPSSSPLR